MKKLLILLALLSCYSYGQNVQIPSIFSDNMVLQQNTTVPFWGKGIPNTQAVIKSEWNATAKTLVQQDGSWKTSLKTPKAGGPYNITLQVGDSIITFKNVLIGEVWLCSGQSNMEMPLEGWPPNDTIMYSKQEIKNSTNPNIRFFTVGKAYSHKEEFDCIGTWEVSSPQSSPRFSATAFFFGKKLYEELKIPIGLINSSWGGTPIESWTNAKSLENFPEFQNVLNKIKESGPGMEALNNWILSKPVMNYPTESVETRYKNLSFKDEQLSEKNYDDSKWKEMNLPMLWERSEIGSFDGVVWFRKQVTIPSMWMNKELTVELGPIDDMDATFVNGAKVGGYETEGYWQQKRIYSIPANLVTDSIITIAVRVIDNQGGGGIYGQPNEMKLRSNTESMSISGGWKYCVVAQYLNGKFILFDFTKDEFSTRPVPSIFVDEQTPTALYNGMIAPLSPYAIKGAIWYQGEANVGYPLAYREKQNNMVNGWRADFERPDFPFYYVQIAPWNYGENSYSQRIREEQMAALSYKNFGMAVTMDIGNPNNIHPTNKKDVGTRLALWALAKDYKKKVDYSGPIYKSMKINKDKIEISFEYGKGLNLIPRNGESYLTIAGEDSLFKKADFKIVKDKLIVFSPEVKSPVAVRYAWSNIQEGTLFNKAGLPASSFRTDNWEK